MPPTYCPENQKPEEITAAEPSGLTYCLVHGSFHGSWCWELLRPELEKLGHKTTAVHLPFDRKSANYDLWADLVAEHIEDPSNTVLVPHSRMGNIAPPVAYRKAIRQIIYLCAGFDPSNNPNFMHPDGTTVPDKYHPQFQAGISVDKNGMAKLSRETALETLYHDCDRDVAEAAADYLRPMHRPSVQPAVENWTNTPAGFIYTGGDRVLTRKYEEHISRAENLARNIGNRVFMLEGGHTPHLSRPAELAIAIDGLTVKVGQSASKTAESS